MIDIDSGKPRQPFALSASGGLQTETAMSITLGRLPGQIMLQEGHAVTAPVGAERDLSVRAPIATEAEVTASRPGITIGLRVGIFLTSIVIFVGLKAPDIASGFLIEVAALEQALNPPVLPVVIDAQRRLLLIVSRGVLIAAVTGSLG